MINHHNITTTQYHRWLYNNRLSSIPPRAFDALTSLNYLWVALLAFIFKVNATLLQRSLNNNQLTVLSPGAFDSLSSLQYMYNNWSTHFSSISNVTFRSLNNNILSSLPPGLFTAMSHLQYLFVHSTRLNKALLMLYCRELNNNVLTSLPFGIFDTLTSLQYLWVKSLQCLHHPISIKIYNTQRQGALLQQIDKPSNGRLQLSQHRSIYVSEKSRIDRNDANYTAPNLT